MLLKQTSMGQVDLRREMGLLDSVMLIAGSTIGIGIFVTTGFVAQHLPSPGGILLVWLLGGLLALTGALSCAELGASLPYAGGDYIYLREAYGRPIGFLSGWSSFFVTFSGSIASLAVGFTQYLAAFFPVLERDSTSVSAGGWGLPLELSSAHFFSIAVILVLSCIHVAGIKPGSRAQNVLTLLKIGALLMIVVLALTIGKGSSSHFFPLVEPGGIAGLGNLGAAFIPVIFTYSGWNAVIYMAAEVKQPVKNLPRALLLANLLIIFLYLSVNVVYLYGVPVEGMQGRIRVAELATTSLFGDRTSGWLTVIIALSILGALNALIMTGPRIYYAMARDRLFFSRLATIHPRFHTPARSILLQALWSSFLVLTGTFDALLTFVTVIIVLFSALTVGALLVLRITRPGLSRPFKIPGYPVLPSLFILAHIAIALATLWQSPLRALMGVGIVGLGVPAYVLWSRQKS